MKLLLLLIPLATAFARVTTRKYIFSALTSLICAVLVAVFADTPLLFAGLFLSVPADYFMAHKNGRVNWFCAGILAFLAAHLLYCAHAIRYARFSLPLTLLGAVMLVAYGVYLRRRILPATPHLLKLPAAIYTITSIVSLILGTMTHDLIYTAGIALLLFSDTLIAEREFPKYRKYQNLILPTYYLCHIALALSAML
ncbi:MAG: lysoplasmalogenase family protein [Christensenellales bacterium]|nr:lysoplasmalogenase family protein [Christensenellales bacterium]